MAKILRGKVISTNMQDTAIVEVVRRVPHKMYKKLLKRSKKYKVDVKGKTVSLSETVRIIEVKPISKDKHFTLYDGGKK